jgi:hypothetical protein
LIKGHIKAQSQARVSQRDILSLQRYIENKDDICRLERQFVTYKDDLVTIAGFNIRDSLGLVDRLEDLLIWFHENIGRVQVSYLSDAGWRC